MIIRVDDQRDTKFVSDEDADQIEDLIDRLKERLADPVHSVCAKAIESRGGFNYDDEAEREFSDRGIWEQFPGVFVAAEYQDPPDPANHNWFTVVDVDVDVKVLLHGGNETGLISPYVSVYVYGPTATDAIARLERALKA